MGVKTSKYSEHDNILRRQWLYERDSLAQSERIGTRLAISFFAFAQICLGDGEEIT